MQTETLHLIFDNIEKYLDGNGVQPSPLELEKFRSDLAGSLAYQEHVNSWNLEGFRQIIALGQSTLRSIMLINGGAAVALLAFVGNLFNSPRAKIKVVPFANSMGWFVFGVFLSAVAYALTYFSQLSYGGDKTWHQRVGLALHVLTSLVGTAALVAFLWGASLAYHGFVAFGS